MIELVHADLVFFLISALVNIITAALIVFRLLYHQRFLRNALGVEYRSPYTSTITKCVESSALMVIANGMYTILYFAPVSMAGVSFMLDVIPHISVGGLELNDFRCTSKIFDTTRLSPRSSSSIVLL